MASSFIDSGLNPNMEIDINDNKEEQNNNIENNANNNGQKGIIFDSEPGVSTLDEAITKSIKRDLKMILEKAKIAMLPFKANKEGQDKLKEWDFWGPLIFCFLLGIFISLGKKTDQNGLVFISIFLLVWIGGLIVSLNSQFLGVKLSIYQCISILGYCMFAIVVAGLLNVITGFLPILFRIVFSIFGFVYSSYGIFLYNFSCC